MGKNPNPRSRMNIPIIFPKAWKQFLGLTILKFFDADPGSGNQNLVDPGSGTPGSGINIPDPQ
jgi:hypothetical protein